MSNIKERLDSMKKLIQEDDFLEGKGLSNEVNIRMFCYDPKEEMTVRYFINHLYDSDLKCKPCIVDLYSLFLEICEDNKILDKIPALEEKRGKDFLDKQFERTCSPSVFATKVEQKYSRQDNRMLILTGVGKVFPFMRVHALLEALQVNMNDIPIVVMYPGTFDGHYVRLFNRLKPNEYYRAFNLI